MEKCRYKIWELKEYKAAKIKKELEWTLKIVTDLRERLSYFEQLEIIDFIAAEKSSILRNFHRLKIRMHKLYGLEDQYLNSEMVDRIMSSIYHEGTDNSEKDYIMDSVEKIARDYSAIIDQVKLIVS